VLTDNKDDTNLLDRRKNWRSYYLPVAMGSKCMMMGGWQEMSGLVNPAYHASTDFWSTLREHIGKTDLNEGEELSALGFIKRRFAHHFATLSAPLSSGLTVQGWPFKPENADVNSPLHVPSLPYLAAVPWLEAVIASAKEDGNGEVYEDLNDVLKAAKAIYAGEPSANVNFSCLKNKKHSITKVDGMSFFPEMITTDQLYRNDSGLQRKKKRELEQCIKRLNRSSKIIPPSPFYALLIMDGDSLGIQMSVSEKQIGISKALNKFTRQVQGIVSKHNGFLIYAGGDDVLALFPLEYALPCAIDIRELYHRLFADEYAASTISAGIQYAHIKSPLMKVIGDAHHLLDDIAKEKSGRDSLAIRVHKPGGLHCEWQMPWDIFLNGQALVEVVKILSENNQLFVTNGWLAHVYELIVKLTDKNNNLIIDTDSFERLVQQAYLHSAGAKTLPTEIAGATKLLLDACSLKIRKAKLQENGVEIACDNFIPTYFPGKDDTPQYQKDAIKLIRFLASKGVL